MQLIVMKIYSSLASSFLLSMLCPDQVETSLRVQEVHQQVQGGIGRAKASKGQQKTENESGDHEQEEDCDGNTRREGGGGGDETGKRSEGGEGRHWGEGVQGGEGDQGGEDDQRQGGEQGKDWRCGEEQ